MVKTDVDSKTSKEIVRFRSRSTTIRFKFTGFSFRDTLSRMSG